MHNGSGHCTSGAREVGSSHALRLDPFNGYRDIDPHKLAVVPLQFSPKLTIDI